MQWLKKLTYEVGVGLLLHLLLRLVWDSCCTFFSGGAGGLKAGCKRRMSFVLVAYFETGHHDCILQGGSANKCRSQQHMADTPTFNIAFRVPSSCLSDLCSA